jgi:hypothetical protein
MKRTFIAALAVAEAIAASAAAARPVVIELYTAQGCSSCPPADAALLALSRRPEFLAIAFHVDYWNDLGWRDPFSMAEATARQKRFGETLRLPTVGTPQLIVEGRRSVLGASADALNEALSAAREDVGIEASVQGADLVVSVPKRATPEPYDLYVISYLPEAETHIARGENAGLTLKEANIARSIRRFRVAGADAQTWKVAIASFPKDATHVLVLLQHAGQGAVAGATSLSVR